jgi:hypothetical protein
MTERVKLYIHEAVKESVIRLYDSPDGYAKRKKYLVELTVDYETPTTVYVSGFMSKVKLTGADIEDMKEYARQKGIKTLRYERDGVITEEQL